MGDVAALEEQKGMKMLYHIIGLCPSVEGMSSCNFGIKLWPAWKEAVANSGLTQEKINGAIKNLGRGWLDGCGYGAMHDPDKSPMDEWEERHTGKTPKLGPNATKLYETYSIRISWGEWGPEHITVPGDACGLDLDSGYPSPMCGRTLQPHNIDAFKQVMLLLTIFTWIADGFVLAEEIKERESDRKYDHA